MTGKFDTLKFPVVNRSYAKPLEGDLIPVVPKVGPPSIWLLLKEWVIWKFL